MKIYIYYSENCNKLKHFNADFIECIYFKDLSEVSINDLNSSVKRCIFCVDDTLMEEHLRNTFKNVLIINTEFLNNYLGEYKCTYTKSLGTLFKSSVVLFSEFQDQNLLTELQFKVLVMGGSVVKDYSNEELIITHVIPYKITEEHVKQINEYPFPINVYTSYWIEYFWSKSSTIMHAYNELNNSYIQEVIKPKYFFNLKIHLLGFEDGSLDEMISIIDTNRGSIYPLKYASDLDCIVVPNNFQIENFLKEFELIPKHIYKNIVYEKWWKNSTEDQYLHSFDDYRVFSDSDSTNFDDAKEECDISPQDLSSNETFHCKSTCNFQINIKEIRECINNVRTKSCDIVYCSNSHLSPDANSKEQIMRKMRIEDFVKYIKSKIGIFTNFYELKNKLPENSDLDQIFEFFQSIGNFFQILHDILQPLVENYQVDHCLGLEILPHYCNAKKYFQSYNSKFNKIVEIVDRLDKENTIVRERFHEFATTNQQSSVRHFIDSPKQIMIRNELYLTEFVNSTSRHHPDIQYLNEIISLHKAVTNFLNASDETYIEAQNQLLVINCIGNPAIFNGGNRYKTVVDCMQFYEDGLKNPKTLFLFDNTLIICQFKSSGNATKNYEAVLSKMTKFNDPDVDRCELSSWSSRQSLCSQSPRSASPMSVRAISRNNSVKSEISISSGKKLEGTVCAKFHKLFTGLSELNWPNKPVNLYTNAEIIDKENIVSIYSELNDSSVAGQLFFTIQCIDRKTGHLKRMRFQLIPRVMKISKYSQIKTALPKQYEWDVDVSPDSKWDKFILSQKRSFCTMFSDHYNAEFSEDLDPKSLTLSINSDFDNVHEEEFKTPFQKKSTKIFGSKKSSSHISSPLTASNGICGRFRRFSKLFSKKSSVDKQPPDMSSSFYDEEEETVVPFNNSSPVNNVSKRINKRKSCTGDNANKGKSAKY